MPFKKSKARKAQPMMPWKVTNKYVPPATGPFSKSAKRAFALEMVRHKAAIRSINKLKTAFRKKRDSWTRAMSRSSRMRYK